ncbi:GntR family transcriptional regulator [Pseudochelatococcus sp. B33]
MSTIAMTDDSGSRKKRPSVSENSGGTLAHAALDRIIELIRSGELMPGGIVNEVDLAKRFDMSRGPIREAIRHLEGRKLIVREAYQRARIVPLGSNQIREIFELRECLEGMACRLATRIMTDEQMEAFVAQVEHVHDAQSLARFYTTDFRFNFHLLIVENCGNRRIQDLLTNEVYELVRLYRWTAKAEPGRDGMAHIEHWQIARAMKTRDENLAESLMRTHIQRSKQADTGI